MKANKLIGRLALASSAVAAGVLSLPTYAMALGWKADDMISGAGSEIALNPTSVTQESFAGWVQTFTTWVLGLAIVAFVLKVVLTAIDRMIFGGTSADNKGQKTVTGGGILSQIPVIGAYEPAMPWKEIWIHFGKQLAIVAGAWIIVNLLSGVVLFVFSAIGGGN